MLNNNIHKRDSLLRITFYLIAVSFSLNEVNKIPIYLHISDMQIRRRRILRLPVGLKVRARSNNTKEEEYKSSVVILENRLGVIVLLMFNTER